MPTDRRNRALACLLAAALLLAPGCGEDVKTTSANAEKTLVDREKSLKERQEKQAPANRPRR